jgi:hypothetical protein
VQPPGPIDLPRQAEAILAKLVELRGIAAREPIPSDVLTPEAFAQRQRNRLLHVHAPANEEGERARWLAFDLGPSDVSPRELARRVTDEQVIAFYDSNARRIAIRNNANGDARVILAHEIEHALQHQKFGFPTDTLTEGDRFLARAAVFEGDATLTMAAFAASLAKRSMAQIAPNLIRNLSLENAKRMAGTNSELDRAPLVVREEILFPYLQGARFLAEIFRAGGFALVDRVFEHPPISTEQVLHPDKYVAGEPPIPVGLPSLPPEWRIVSSGSLGELGIRIALSGCENYTSHGRSFGEGWGGDAYAIAEGPDHELALLWSTVWDDDAGANYFSDALYRRAKCWHAPERDGEHWWMSNDYEVHRKGNRIMLVRGLEGVVGLRHSTLLELAYFVSEPPPRDPPLGDIKLQMVSQTDWAPEEIPLATANCAAGIAEQCARLGWGYVQGNGLPKDRARAEELLTRSCKLKPQEGACRTLGLLYGLGHEWTLDIARAISFFKRGCDGGDGRTCILLGDAYRNGKVMAIDAHRADALDSDGCQKDPAACDLLGLRHVWGGILQKDPAQAFALFKLACERHFAIGCAHEGLCYEQGVGVEKDPTRGAALRADACRSDPIACDVSFKPLSLLVPSFRR